MITHHYSSIQNGFKLNGKTFNEETLKNLAYSFVKEGAEYEKEIGQFLLDWLNPKDHIIVHTSGSTGVPKPIKLSKIAMVNSAIATGTFFNLKGGHTALLCLPASYIAGKMMLVRALVLGLEIDCINPSSKIELKTKTNYTFVAMVPMQVQNSMESLREIKILILGGASVPLHLIPLFKNIKTQVYETYGMTETITHIALKKLNNFDEEQSHSTPFFKTLPNVSITKDDRNCLVIEAPKLRTKKIVTNDVVILHSSRKFEWLGRYDNIINSGGIKMNPEQIEKKLKTVFKQRFFITSEKDNVLGERIVLVIETDDNNIEEVIFSKLKAVTQIDYYEIPKKIIPVSKFKETNSGKIKRNETMTSLKK